MQVVMALAAEVRQQHYAPLHVIVLTVSEKHC